MTAKTYSLKLHPALFVAVLFCSTAVQFSCDDPKPCPKADTITYNLSAAEKAFIPYKGHETLTFVSNLGDTMHFYGQGRKTHYEKDDWTSGDCPGPYFELENDEASFKSDSAGWGKMRVLSFMNSGNNNFVEINFDEFESTYLTGADTAIINGRKYYPVSKCFGSLEDQRSVGIYYSPNEGVIKFNFLTKQWALM